MDDKEIFDLVRQSYASANADYISEQIRITSQNLPDIKQEGATAMGGFLNFIKEYSMKILKRLFCKHKYAINRWHYTHGQCGNEPAYIEGYEVCKHCGKEKYFWVERGSKLESWIESTLQDKHA